MDRLQKCQISVMSCYKYAINFLLNGLSLLSEIINSI